MPKRKIRIIGCVPGAAHLRPILRDFLRGGQGWITSLADGRLRAISRLVETEIDSIRPFGEVVGEMLTRLRAQKLPLAQAGHVHAAVAEASLLLPEDSVFFEAARFPGTHRRIEAALGELRHWGLDGDSLAAAAEAASGTLASKLESLAFVENEVARSLHAIARERATDRIAACLDLADDGTDLGRLLVVCGSELDQIHLDWLSWFASVGADISIVGDYSAGSLFRGLFEALERLDGKTTTAGEPNNLQAGLFQASRTLSSADARDRTGSPSPASHLDVRIESSADMLSESEWVLRAILEELQSGTEPSRVAIFCRDTEGYMPLLSAAARRFDVPISCSRRLPLLGNSFARFILDILSFCASDDVRALAPVLRSSYLHLENCLRIELEQALKEAYKAKELQWKTLDEWVAAHTEEVHWLQFLLDWRKRWMTEPAPLHAWCDRLMEFGQQPWQDEALSTEGTTGVRDQYAQSAMLRNLAQHASIRRTYSTRPLNLPQFVSLCKSIWGEADVSPAFDAGAVQVVASTFELADIDSLYVLGLLEGVFPRRRSEDPILSDEERSDLSALFPQKLPFPNSRERAEKERDEFYRLCGAARERLVLCYPQTDDDRDNVPAFYLAEVSRALGEVPKLDRARSDICPEGSPAEADGRLRAAVLATPPRPPLPNVLTTSAAKAAVTETGERWITPRSLGDVLECPFRYLAESALRLAPNRRRSRWHHLFRLPARTGLASLPFRESAENALKAALESEIDRLVADSSRHDLALMRSGGERLIEEWLNREFQSRSLWPRDTIQDLPSFEHGHLKSKVKTPEGSVALQGSFPALSHRNGYRILHLFRASEPWTEMASREEDPWSRLTEKDAFEFALYLAALWRPEEPRVGIEVDSASGARNLFLLPRPEEPIRSDQAQMFKVTVIDDDQRGRLFRSVGESVATAMNRIRQADVEARPGEHCSNCECGELCRRSRQFSEEIDVFERDG